MCIGELITLTEGINKDFKDQPSLNLSEKNIKGDNFEMFSRWRKDHQMADRTDFSLACLINLKYKNNR